MNQKVIEKLIRSLLKEIGENPDREGLLDTPKRVAKAYEETLSGYKKKAKDIIRTFDSDGYDEIVICKDIEFYSFCEHHMLPFYGKVHIAYLPDKRVLGLSKLARIVDIYAHRLQIQEQMTKQISDSIMEVLQPKGVGVIVEGKHLCMMMRGVQKQNSSMITSSMVGEFRENPSLKAEFMGLIHKG
jgi:GTP cyclohydrolase I